MSIVTLQSQDFGDKGQLSMILHVNAHYARMKPGSVIEISFLTPEGGEDSWNCNNVEYHDPSDVRAALAAFDERAANGGWDISSKGKSLGEILEADS